MSGPDFMHVPPPAAQASSQFWPNAPSCHAMPSLPHSTSARGASGGAGGAGGDGGGSGGSSGGSGGDGEIPEHGQNRRIETPTTNPEILAATAADSLEHKAFEEVW